jgi:hypothetical protein
MKNIFKILMLIMFMFVSEQGFALRCGNKLVDVGDPKPKVLHLCGEPVFKETREIRYPSHCIDGSYQHDDGFYDRRRYGQYNYQRYTPNFVTCRYRTFDIWIYNFGPRKFMIELIFRRGIVKEINTLSYGY